MPSPTGFSAARPYGATHEADTVEHVRAPCWRACTRGHRGEVVRDGPEHVGVHFVRPRRGEGRRELGERNVGEPTGRHRRGRRTPRAVATISAAPVSSAWLTSVHTARVRGSRSIATASTTSARSSASFDSSAPVTSASRCPSCCCTSMVSFWNASAMSCRHFAVVDWNSPSRCCCSASARRRPRVAVGRVQERHLRTAQAREARSRGPEHVRRRARGRPVPRPGRPDATPARPHHSLRAVQPTRRRRPASRPPGATRALTANHGHDAKRGACCSTSARSRSTIVCHPGWTSVLVSANTTVSIRSAARRRKRSSGLVSSASASTTKSSASASDERGQRHVRVAVLEAAHTRRVHDDESLREQGAGSVMRTPRTPSVCAPPTAA